MKVAVRRVLQVVRRSCLPLLCLSVLHLAGAGPTQAQISAGDVVVTDRLADGIIRIDLDGTQTLLGTGGSINSPRGLAVDGDGFLYLTSTSGTVWRAFSDAGGGSQDLIRFGSPLKLPRGLVVAPLPNGLATNGTLYVAEKPAGFPNGLVWQVDTATGAISSSSEGGFLNLPTGIAREPGGTLLVASGSTVNFNGLFRVDPATFDPSNPSANQEIVSERGMLVFPQRPAIQTQGGQTQAVFLTDFGGTPLGSSETFPPQVLCIDASVPFDPFDPKANQTQLSSGGSLERPVGIVIEDPGSPGVANSGKLLVASADAEAIVRITFTPDAGGAPCPAPGSGVQTILTQGGLLDLPWDLQVMPPPDPFEAQPFYISDTSDSGGAVYFVEPVLDSRTEIVPGSFSNPTGLALDLDGHLIVLDDGDGSVYRVRDPDPRSGIPSLELPPLATGLSGPTGVVVDSEGHILVVDRDAEEIWRIRPAGAPILIARHDPAEPTDPLVDPVGATLGVDGQLIVADAGDASTGDVPRLVQVDPSTGFRQVIAFPVPSLPPLAGIVGDQDGSNLVTGDGSQSETLVRQSLPIGSPTYRSESDDSVFVQPRGLDLDANRSVLVVDAVDDDTSTQTGVVRRVDTVSPPDTAPADVPTGATGFFFDPYDIAVAIPPDPPVLDLDADGVPDGSDNCSSTQNPPSVCSADQRTACAPNDDECFSRGRGSCAVNVCSENQNLACAGDADCGLDFGSCLDEAVCSGDQLTPCTNSADCDDAGLGSCIQDLCSLDTTVVCAEDTDCTPDLGPCLISVCTGDGSSCNANLGSCEQAGLGSCIQLDEDGDEVGNACDNCQLLANTPDENPQFGQDDQDGDGLGDACDPCDVDGSGVTDSVDLDLLNAVYFDHDGACSLDDVVPCDVDADCPDQTCDANNLCSLNGLTCIDDDDCAPNTCGPSPADCDADGDVDEDDRGIVVADDGVVVGPGFDFDEDFIADQTDVCPDAFDPSVCSLDGSLCDIPAPGDPNPCPGTETCTQPDADLDGVGDACNDLDDTDLDEIADAFDNCVIDVNEKLCSSTGSLCIFDTDCASGETCEQTDEDGDGFGDICDTCLGSAEFSSCTLDLVQCAEDSDCATQTCDGNVCSLDDLSCNDDADCATQTCEFDGDRDGDRIQNTCDVCPDDFDPRVCSSSGLGCRFDFDCTEEGETCIDQPDQDSDGIGDACDPDVDGDGTDDVDDNCPTDANMDQSDGDSDEVGDVCDPCPDDFEPPVCSTDGTPCSVDADCSGGQTCGPPDTDGDLIHDACDICPMDQNPRLCTGTNLACIIDADCEVGICEPQVDSDADTAGDRCDSCPSDSDPPVCSTDGTPCSVDADCSGSQTCGPPDEDGDGVGDACDACPGSPEPMLCTDDFTMACDDDNDCVAGLCVFAPDIDSDGIQNTCDLCPQDFDPWVCEDNRNIECRLPNDCPDMGACVPRDFDGDGTPDACDANIDDDMFDNDQDNCNDVHNDGQEDANSDGIGDACDPDFSNDGRVTAPDFTALSLAFGQASFPDGLDTTGDGNVAAPEFTLLSLHFGSETIDWGLPGCDGRAPPSSPLPAGCDP